MNFVKCCCLVYDENDVKSGYSIAIGSNTGKIRLWSIQKNDFVNKIRLDNCITALYYNIGYIGVATSDKKSTKLYLLDQTTLGVIASIDTFGDDFMSKLTIVRSDDVIEGGINMITLSSNVEKIRLWTFQGDTGNEIERYNVDSRAGASEINMVNDIVYVIYSVRNAIAAYDPYDFSEIFYVAIDAIVSIQSIAVNNINTYLYFSTKNMKISRISIKENSSEFIRTNKDTNFSIHN